MWLVPVSLFVQGHPCQDQQLDSDKPMISVLFYSFDQLFSTGGSCVHLREQLAMPRDDLGCHDWRPGERWEILPLPTGQGPKMLLSILQYTGPHLETKNHQAPSLSKAALEKPLP